MSGISFLELVIVGMVALVVLGPERLPGAIRTISLWVGRLRRSFNTIKQDIEREIGADEIRRQLRNEAIMEKFKHTKAQVQDTVSTVRKETEALRKSADLESQVAAFTSQGSNSGNKATASVESPGMENKTTTGDTTTASSPTPASNTTAGTGTPVATGDTAAAAPASDKGNQPTHTKHES